MIRPITLGKINFPVNVIQGPLAGISCAPFRRLTWEYSQPAFSCTEMISCKTLLHSPIHLQQRFVRKDPKEGPVCFQLSSHDPVELGQATRQVCHYGADLIDLNCGCPVKKIRNKGAGSRLLTDPSQIYALIKSMKQNTTVPVSVKIRVEGKSKEKFNATLASAINDASPDFVIVHGRHWTEHYETPCHYDNIQFFVENLTMPVIGNGDIACLDSLKKMFSTGCAGVMISRAGVGQPWLIGKLIAQMQEKDFAIPTPKQIAQIFLTHVKELSELLQSEKFAILQARKFAKYYGRMLENRADFCSEVNRCDNIMILSEICEKFFLECVK